MIRRDTYPLGCHRPRIPDRIVFDKLIQVLVFGCGYRRIADATCSATTLRRRRDYGSPWAWPSSCACWCWPPMTGCSAPPWTPLTVLGPLPSGAVVQLDAGYDYDGCREVLAARGLADRIAAPGAAAPRPGQA
jgi:hypothetical protein